MQARFQWCTHWEVGNGKTISFWYDNWGSEPIRSIRDRQGRPQSQLISLHDAVFEASPVLDFYTGTIPVLSEYDDRLTWRWSAHGVYTASSFYNLIISAGKIKWPYMEVWAAAAPSKVKTFAYLLLQDRILTHDVMERRGMNCEMRCVMCDECPVESAHHLFFACTNAQQVWSRFQLLVHYSHSVESTWDASWRHYCHTTGHPQKVWTTAFMAVLWSLWRQRNAVIFRNSKLPTTIVAARANEEAVLWGRYCGKSKAQHMVEAQHRRRDSIIT